MKIPFSDLDALLRLAALLGPDGLFRVVALDADAFLRLVTLELEVLLRSAALRFAIALPFF